MRPRSRTRLSVDERRTQLLDLGRRLFNARPYDAISIDEIAAAAGISKGLLYHYFPTKRDLYVAGLSEIAGELVTAVTSIPGDLSPVERARAGLDAYLDHITRHKAAFVSLMRGGIGSDPEVADVIEGVRSRMFDTFLKDQPFAPLVAGDPRFETAVRGWIGFVEFTTIDWAVNARLSRTELRDLLTDILFQVLVVVTPPVFRTQ